MNHSRALRTTCNANSFAVDAAGCKGALRARIRGHNRARQTIKGARRESERFSEARGSFQDALDGERNTDYSGRTDDHLLRATAEKRSDSLGRSARSDHAARPDGTI